MNLLNDELVNILENTFNGLAHCLDYCQEHWINVPMDTYEDTVDKLNSIISFCDILHDQLNERNDTLLQLRLSLIDILNHWHRSRERALVGLATTNANDRNATLCRAAGRPRIWISQEQVR